MKLLLHCPGRCVITVFYCILAVNFKTVLIFAVEEEAAEKFHVKPHESRGRCLFSVELLEGILGHFSYSSAHWTVFEIKTHSWKVKFEYQLSYAYSTTKVAEL
jgi:hypothetical protein